MKKVFLFVALILALNAVAPAASLVVGNGIAYARHTAPDEDPDRGRD